MKYDFKSLPIISFPVFASVAIKSLTGLVCSCCIFSLYHCQVVKFIIFFIDVKQKDQPYPLKNDISIEFQRFQNIMIRLVVSSASGGGNQ